MQVTRSVFLFFAFTCAVIGSFANDTTGTRQHNKLAGANNYAGITLPQGFSAVVFADDLGRARHLAVNSNGDVYVKLERLKNGKGIFRLKDTNGDGKSDQVTSFGNYVGTGIAIKNGYLYASSNFI